MIKLLTALTVVTLLAAMAAASTVKPKLFSTVGVGAAPLTITISVEELQRQVDVRTLQLLKSKTSIEAIRGSATRRCIGPNTLHAAGRRGSLPDLPCRNFEIGLVAMQRQKIGSEPRVYCECRWPIAVSRWQRLET